MPQPARKQRVQPKVSKGVTEPPKATPLLLSQPTPTSAGGSHLSKFPKHLKIVHLLGPSTHNSALASGGTFQTQTISPTSFSSKKTQDTNYLHIVSVLLCDLYSKDGKKRKFLGEKNHLQLSITRACKRVGFHLLLSYKQAKSLKGFNFPTLGFVMGLLYPKEPNCFKGNDFMKNPMRRSRTYALEASCSWAFLWCLNHKHEAKGATSRKLKNRSI